MFTEEEIEQFIDITTGLLLFQGERYAPVAYSYVNDVLGYRTGRKFPLDRSAGRNGLAGVLAEINNRTMPQIEAVIGRKALLSSMAIHKNSNDIGRGYYAYAWQQGLLRSRTRAARDMFLVDQMRLINDYCKRVA
jgi:hypothetical protein